MNSTIRTAGVTLGLLAAATLTACSGPSAPTPTRTVTATVTPTPTADPGTPMPTPSPTATGTAFDLSDPATWTISTKEVGPIALGGEVEGEIDDLAAAYTRSTDACPASPETTFWNRDDAPGLIVIPRDGKVVGVTIGGLGPDPVTTNSPETDAGIGIGTPLTEVRSAYPDLQYTGTYGEDQGPYSMWSVQADGRYMTFQLGMDGATVGAIWVGSTAMLPYEYCA
ncbi:hypothetical protein H489_0102435 [Curtobacterium flaccumfaciens UCD-AKU]|uniref:hypothetical protein n=1 Tax=Curtobacterium flaccumfaciens TaxID=2035 RepID=UPI00036AA929|nr:hypothetical protein [Curtobacterium flaccumfaciens]EYT66500.1 hypothetical protein H489_0102435 [Curtobacterium flaccumfaciens UCD-AKU]